MLEPNKIIDLDEESLQKEVYEFLTTTGNNKKLAKIMSNTKGFCDKGKLEVKTLRLSELIRIAGPNKEYFEEQKVWDKKIAQMIKSIKSGWEPPALIVWNKDMTIADGAHRFEALKKLGKKEYACIVWIKN
ncbi:MAG: ParB/RepB/Spo0J family partition protein [Candidatus Woesearchaeota archaeon]